LVEEQNDLLLSIVWISPFQRLEGLIPIDERQIRIDTLSEIGPMGIPLGGCKHDMFQTDISRIHIDPAISVRSRVFLLETIRPLFYLGKKGDRDE
jgi:hypothetical protein